MYPEDKILIAGGALIALAFTVLFYFLAVENDQFMSEYMADGLKRYQCKALSEGHTQYINIVRTK